MPGSSFRFRLERVRALRERSEDQAKQALAEAMAGQQRCHEALTRAEQHVERARQAQPASTGATSTGADLIAVQAFLERAERVVDAARHDLQRHEHHVEERRQALRAAARERQALERLKEHRRADHEREQARLDGLALDEIAINGFRRSAA